LGAALRELGRGLDTDLLPNSPDRKGDYKPLAFLLTDGAPTDEWRSAAQALKSRTTTRMGTFVALGCGDKIDTNVLKEVTDNVLLMRDGRQVFFGDAQQFLEIADPTQVKLPIESTLRAFGNAQQAR